MLEGELEEGELEIGQVSALLKEILPHRKCQKYWEEFTKAFGIH